MNSLLPAERILDEFGVPYRIFQHSSPPGSLEQAASERAQVPGQIIRSILFRLSSEEFVLVLVAGPGQISWQKLRAALGVSRLTMADESEVLQVTGAPVGAVGPFGIMKSVRIMIDESVFLHEEISIGSGARGRAIIMKSSDLTLALPAARIGSWT